MFCKNCGNELADGTSFCPSCGTAQNDAAVTLNKGTPISAQVDERKQVLAVMDDSFSVMTSIKQKENEIEEKEEQIEKTKEKARKRYVVLWSFIGFMITCILEGIIGTALASVFFFGGIAFGVWRMISKKKESAALEAEKQTLENTLLSLKNDPVLLWLPYDYRDSTSFTYLYTYLTNLRANSLKEAINLYETEKHQERLELISAVTAQAASDAASSANAAAGAAAASAFFSLFR